MKYFAYGSNMNPERMRQRRINFSKREWAVLKGWRLEFNKMASSNPNEGYANIVRANITRDSVEGILYEISGEDIKNLDRYEGYPNHYDKINVKLELNGGSEVEAITYIAQPDKTRNGLKPSREYLNHLLKGCDLLSEEYCDKLRKKETLD